jgi:hypothetical protein
MYSNDFPKGELRFQKLPSDTSSLIAVADYCQREHLSRSGALYRIKQRQVKAWKLQGRWWILPVTPP